MATLIIDYDVLGDIAKASKKLAKRADEYADALSKKVIGSIDDIERGGSDLTRSARYYVKQKVSNLRDKSDEYSRLSTKVTDYVDKAKRIDGEVEKLLQGNQKSFLKDHENLRVSEWKAKLLNFLVDMKNKFPVLDMIGNGLRILQTELSSLWDNIQYWYHCEGGKQVVDLVLAIGGAILAIALFIVTLPASGFFAVCAAIGAAIAAINSIVNIFTSGAALWAVSNGDPAWARIYGNQDKLSDVLRQTNFDNKWINRLTNFGAFALDAVELFTAVVGFVELGKKIVMKVRKPNFLNNFFSRRTGLLSYFKENGYHQVLDYDEFGNICGTKWVLKANENGIVETKYTLKSIWNGIKTFVMDKEAFGTDGKGLRSMLVDNLKIDFTDFRRSLTLKGLKETFIYNATDGGRVTRSDFKNSFNVSAYLDTVRYNIKNSSFVGMFDDGMDWSKRRGYIKKSVGTIKDIVKYTRALHSGDLASTVWDDIKSSVAKKSDAYTLYKGAEGLVKSAKTLHNTYKPTFEAVTN